jgi:prepilin-type N-terminal cleavage/methylation domain-containing protein
MKKSLRNNGFVLLELLIVLVVVAILAGGYFSKNRTGENAQSTYQMSMQRSNNTACIANRAALKTQIQMFKMNNPTTPVSTENLQKASINVPVCPQKGAYGFTPDGNILCSYHDAK